MQTKRIQLKFGFTLIELMISTAIIMMVLTVTLPAFISFQRRQALVSAGQALRDVILDTQNYSLAPRSGEGVDGGKQSGADRYRIIFLRDVANPGFDLEEETSRMQNGLSVKGWQRLKHGSLPFGVSYCNFSSSTPSLYTAGDPLAVSEKEKGIIYSIKQLGKIVSPSTADSSLLTVHLRQQSLSEKLAVSIDIATGRVDVGAAASGTVCD